MSEKQLTVAELMARAAAEGREGAPRRRRRRSLEEGGVSVAELTGNLPRVTAKPEEPRHTSEPIDAPMPAKPEPVVETAAAPVAAPEPVVAPAKPEPAKPEPAAEPVVSVVHDDDPIKLTTDSFPAQTAQTVEKAEKAQPVQPEPQEPAPLKASTQDAEETGVIPVVTEELDQEKAEDPGVIPVVVDKPAELEVADDEKDDDSVSIKSIVLMAVVGLALGAAIFLGFKELWANVNNILVGVLAGVMTLGIVGVVHALRTERDGMSMALAGVTGLALTFGPLLIAGL